MAAKLATFLVLCPAWKLMQRPTVDAGTGWRTEQTHICAGCTHLPSVCEDSGPPNPWSEATACVQAAHSDSVVNEQQIRKKYSHNSLRLNIVCPSYLTKTPDWRSHCQELRSPGKDSEEREIHQQLCLTEQWQLLFLANHVLKCISCLKPEWMLWSNWKPGLELNPSTHSCRQFLPKRVTEAVRSPESWYRCEETQLNPYTKVSVAWEGFKIF